MRCTRQKQGRGKDDEKVVKRLWVLEGQTLQVPGLHHGADHT